MPAKCNVVSLSCSLWTPCERLLLVLQSEITVLIWEWRLWLSACNACCKDVSREIRPAFRTLSVQQREDPSHGDVIVCRTLTSARLRSRSEGIYSAAESGISSEGRPLICHRSQFLDSAHVGHVSRGLNQVIKHLQHLAQLRWTIGVMRAVPERAACLTRACFCPWFDLPHEFWLQTSPPGTT